MAFSPVDPIEIASTNYSLSGGAQYVPSGTVTSGTAAFPGPHLIETQSMNIDYVRVPRGFMTNEDISLCSVAATHTVSQTEVVALVTAEYKREKVYNTFSTSAYTQPQTFQILAMSSDPSGNNYGPLTASTLGAMGTIATYQPYHSRRPWDDTLDTTTIQTCYASNYVLVNGTSPDPVDYWNVDQEIFQTRYQHFFLASQFAGTFIPDQGPDVLQTIGNMYRLFGSYSPSQESVPKIISYIDSIGTRVTARLLAAVPGEWNGESGTGNSYAKAGCSLYSTSRHDYTQFH